MAYLSNDDLKSNYEASKKEAHQWRLSYPSFERLADNDLMEGMDENLPEVNDGSLAAALYKLPKRVVSSRLSGTVKALDRDEKWLSDLANIVWMKEIIPYANTQAPFHRKWKDAVRKAAIYGSVPIITIFVESEGKRHADFIVAQPQDVLMEAGKVSDYDSDVMYWDVYYSKTQLEGMIEQAKSETSDKDADSYNKWSIKDLQAILDGKGTESRTSLDSPRQQDGKEKQAGFKFCIAVQRGIDAPFRMYHPASQKTVREWSNPDPTGDINIHFLYCYQDFINPYGTGIVKLAGGTQNVLDYMRQADVLATQLGLRPPIAIEGQEDQVDLDSIVYAQDAIWFTGGAKVVRQEMANGVYQAIPGRMQMYQASLQKLIPTGDTSLSSTDSGDSTMSKTPAGVKLAAANLSIDDEDFKDNLYITYAAVAKSMINTHFANMEGSDLMKLSEDERELLMKGGLEFGTNAEGEMSEAVEVQWDTVRAQFDFEVDPEADKAKDDQVKLEGLTRVLELTTADPTLAQDLASVGKKFNKGELINDIIKLTTDNDKIITDIAPEDQQMGPDGQPITPEQQAAAQAEQQAQAMQQIQQENETLKQQLLAAKAIPYKDAPETVKEQMEQEAGYQREGILSIPQESLVQKEADMQRSDAAQQHSQAMDVVREHNAPDPMEMAKLKSKSDKAPAGVK